MRRVRAQGPAIVDWSIPHAGQNYDVIRLESVNTNYVETGMINEFQSCPGVKHMMVHRTVNVIRQTALVELFLCTGRLIL